MSYTDNRYLNANSEQSAAASFSSDKTNTLMLALAAVMSVIGSAAVGTGSIDTDSLYQMASVAFPQLTAWLISYLMYQNPNAMKPQLTEQKALPAPASENMSK